MIHSYCVCTSILSILGFTHLPGLLFGPEYALPPHTLTHTLITLLPNTRDCVPMATTAYFIAVIFIQNQF